jgi:hypothetical protein
LRNLNTEDPELKAESSERSDILAPYNSTISEDLIGMTESKKIVYEPLIVNQRDYIHYERKVLRAIRNYERNFNKEVDLGVNVGINYSEENNEPILNRVKLQPKVRNEDEITKNVTMYEPPSDFNNMLLRRLSSS